MALRDDEKWILAENLKRQEQSEIAKIEGGSSGADCGDFGAYYALLSGKNPELAGVHAVSSGPYLAAYVRQLRVILETAGRAQRPSILDVGCGPGALTQKILEGFPGSRVRGIDISESAIAYGRRTYPGCRFAVVSVDEKMDLGETFDVVHAREFYPFTRTGDFDFHRKFVEVLAKHVAERGVLVLTILSRPNTLASNADALAPALGKFAMTPFERVTLASARLPAWMPPPLARAFTTLGAKLRGRNDVRFYVSRRL